MSNTMAVQPIAYTTDTPNELILGVGAFFVNIEEAKDFKDVPTYKEILDIMRKAREDGNSLGGTRGGATFTFATTKDQIAIDDMKNPIPGTQVITAQAARLQGTMVELDFANIRRVIPTAHVGEDGGLTATTVLLQSHYLDNILHVSMYGNGDFCVIRLDKALQTDDVTISFGEGVDTGTLPFNYLGHVADAMNAQFAPFKIWRVPMPVDGTDGIDEASELGIAPLSASAAVVKENAKAAKNTQKDEEK